MTEGRGRLRNIKLKIAYNGKNYAGWQIQENDITIQGVMENALSVMHKRHVGLTAAGRTDSGVHARGQVANFLTDITSMGAEKFTPALNSLLPSDIRVTESSEADLAFNSRYDAVERIYTYNITDEDRLMPWERDFSMYVNRKLELARLNDIADAVTGKHDFTAFSAPMHSHVSPVRVVYSSCFYQEYPFLVYRISGNGFLRKMVRSIVGSIVEIFKDGGERDDLERILNSRDRSLCGPTAPARALFLDSVIYRKDEGEKNGQGLAAENGPRIEKGQDGEGDNWGDDNLCGKDDNRADDNLESNGDGLT